MFGISSPVAPIGPRDWMFLSAMSSQHTASYVISVWPRNVVRKHQPDHHQQFLLVSMLKPASFLRW